MKAGLRYAVCVGLGLVGGMGTAVQAVRGGFADGGIRNGPWTTGRDFGSGDASALTRARVALSGLLALPRREAMYFTARTDSAGRPLNGRCRYFVNGAPIDSRWWSLTAYDPTGRLIASDDGDAYSVGSSNFSRDEPRWVSVVGPKLTDWSPPFIATGRLPRLELTLRIYQPGPSVLARPESIALPNITPEGPCGR